MTMHMGLPRAPDRPQLVFDAPDLVGEGRPAPAWRPLFILTFCVWLGSFALSTLRDLAAPPPDFAIITLWRLAFAAFGALLCYPLHRLLAALERRSLPVRLAAALGAIALVSIVYAQATFAVTRVVRPGVEGYGSAWQFYNIVYWALFFVAWAALHAALSYSRQVTEQAHRASVAEALAHDAQLRALRYQVDPHFLFNALNSVSALVIGGRGADAEAMLAKLSSFFRTSLAMDPHHDVRLEEEFALQRLFLEIEQVRYPDMSIAIVLDDEARAALVPALLLQPVIENAVKYGVASREGPARIAISAAAAGGRLHLVVEDDGVGRAKAKGTGTGLGNVRERLQARFGEAFEMEAGPIAAGGYRVRLVLPARPAA